MLIIIGGNKFDLNTFAGSYNMGVGFDTGVLAHYPFSDSLKLNFGAAFIDIGTTKYGASAAAQKGEFNVGTSLKYDPGIVSALFSYEYSNVFNSIDILAKQHFGFELGFPFVTGFAGFNQVYYTYGGAVDLWAVRVVAVSYGTEQATYVRQSPSRRYLLRLEMKFEL